MRFLALLLAFLIGASPALAELRGIAGAPVMATVSGPFTSNATGLSMAFSGSNTTGNIGYGTAASIVLNQALINDDAYYTSTQRQTIGYVFDYRKNASNNGLGGNNTINGGARASYSRAWLQHPTALTNTNRNYVGHQMDVYAEYGDGGVFTTTTASGSIGDATISVSSVTSSVADGTTGRIVVGDGLIIVQAGTGKRQSTSVTNVSGTTLTISPTLVLSVASGDAVYAGKGGFFSSSALAYAPATAIGMLNITGAEDNSWLTSGSSTAIKSIRSFVGASGDAVQGSVIDTMALFSNQTGAVKWRNGILFSPSNGSFPISTTGCVLCIDNMSTSTPTIGSGIDFTGATITGNAFAWAHGAFDGAGNISFDGNLTLNKAGPVINVTGGATNTIVAYEFPQVTASNVASIRLFRTNAVASTSSLQIFKGDGTSTAQTNFSAANNSYINAAAGCVGVGSTACAAKLSVSGDITVTGSLSFGTVASPDVFLTRSAANTLAQKNGANAQDFLLYNADTGGTADEWGGLSWQSTTNVLTVGTFKNGSGSTRGIQFAVGGASVWQFDTSGNLRPVNNNSRDIGSASFAVRTVYAGTSVVSPLFTGVLNNTNAYTAGVTTATGYTIIQINGVNYKVNACLASSC